LSNSEDRMLQADRPGSSAVSKHEEHELKENPLEDIKAQQEKPKSEHGEDGRSIGKCAGDAMPAEVNAVEAVVADRPEQANPPDGSGLNNAEQVAVNGIPQPTPEEIAKKKQLSELYGLIIVTSFYLCVLVPLSCTAALGYKNADSSCIARQDVSLYLFFSSFTFCLLVFGYREITYALYLTKIDPAIYPKTDLRNILYVLLCIDLEVQLGSFNIGNYPCPADKNNGFAFAISTIWIITFMISFMTLTCFIFTVTPHVIGYLSIKCSVSTKMSDLKRLGWPDQLTASHLAFISTNAKHCTTASLKTLIKSCYFRWFVVIVTAKVLSRLTRKDELTDVSKCLCCNGTFELENIVVVIQEKAKTYKLVHIYCFDRSINCKYDMVTELNTLREIATSCRTRSLTKAADLVIDDDQSIPTI
jgi:hypothetical protein